jgi:hypothetical protein
MRDPRAAGAAEWENDGLVSVQSARWGELLGTVEGADLPLVRGARGLDLELDLAGLQAVSLAIPTPSLPEWDWSRWLGAWRRSAAANQAQDAAAAAAAAASRNGRAPAPAKDGKNDGGEKLSAFFDWVAEQVPADPLAHVAVPTVHPSERRSLSRSPLSPRSSWMCQITLLQAHANRIVRVQIMPTSHVLLPTEISTLS